MSKAIRNSIDIDSLRTRLDHQTLRLAVFKRVFRTFLVLAIAFPILFRFIPFSTGKAYFYTFLICYGCAIGVAIAASATRLSRATMNSLCQVESKQIVGSVIELWEHSDETAYANSLKYWRGFLFVPTNHNKAILTETLTRLLPLVQQEDASLLTDHQMGCLNRALGKSPPELTIAILNALEQVGDRRSLIDVQRLVDQEKDRDNEVVWTVAQRCATTLRTRLENERSAQTLLRPAQTTENDRLLLRPGKSSEDSEDKLLRIVETDGHKD